MPTLTGAHVWTMYWTVWAPTKLVIYICIMYMYMYMCTSTNNFIHVSPPLSLSLSLSPVRSELSQGSSGGGQ